MWIVICFMPFIFFVALQGLDIENERELLLQKELKMMLGSDIIFSDSDIKANDIIMDLKLRELDNAFKYPQMFNLSKHFFEYKDEVKRTPLFKIIQKMPKGAVLHAHDTGLLSPDYVLELTYLDDLFVCFVDDDVKFWFSLETPNIPCATKWQPMKEARYSSGNVDEFDAYLRKYFTIVINNPNEVYTNVNAAWSAFQQYFVTTSGLFSYKPVWEKYFYDTLKALREENIMYLEIRSVLPPVYDLEGIKSTSLDTAECYKKVVDQFMVDYPDFFGAKLIYAPPRMVDVKTVKDYIKIAKEIKRKMPDFLAGFDLVGQEDLGMPTKEFLPALLEAKTELDYFFHAGETNWYGSSSDENLVDAIVLGTKRIGHAFALIKHPLLLQEVKERGIAIEVNVISNAVLKLVEDIRNHPVAAFLAQDLPVVLSSDDPGVWEADPISHDYYVTFVGVASRHADLKLLKKLALNSLYYSTYPNKDKIVHEFEIRWTKFIDSLVKDKW
ncbi:hypothetical protein K1T71_011354 [Dendrolimus kikuchii]|uniref:Uncharacterized protein n=1 Tax=Dendrolimus kikuchii TaxID=765133 RepID=A0ACC1CNJ9_9NEOP|nr:hypothetical protein K1T71_011354 [Dendrolimus kikuchii]